MHFIIYYYAVLTQRLAMYDGDDLCNIFNMSMIHYVVANVYSRILSAGRQLCVADVTHFDRCRT